MESSYIFTSIKSSAPIELEKKPEICQYKNFNLKAGDLYLVTDLGSTISYLLLNELIYLGYKGIIISKETKEDIKERFAELVDLQEEHRISQDIVPSMFYKTFGSIMNGLDGSNFIFVDRLENLIARNGFEDTLNFVYNLREIAHLKSIIILISVNSSAIKSRYLRLLEKESKSIELGIKYQ